MVENLVVFAPLVLMIVITETGDRLIAAATMMYFCARIAHYMVFLFAVPVVRTLAFMLGFGCQAVLALRLFGLV